MSEAPQITGLTTLEVLMGTASWLDVSAGWLRQQVEEARRAENRLSETGERVPFVTTELDRFMEGLDVAVSRLLDLASREAGVGEPNLTSCEPKTSQI